VPLAFSFHLRAQTLRLSGEQLPGGFTSAFGLLPLQATRLGVWAAGFDRGIGQRQRGRARVRFAAALQAAFSR
jgi:hypothetical protein